MNCSHVALELFEEEFTAETTVKSEESEDSEMTFDLTKPAEDTTDASITLEQVGQGMEGDWLLQTLTVLCQHVYRQP